MVRRDIKISRRRLLGTGLSATFMGVGAVSLSQSALGKPRVGKSPKAVFIILRGGLDGLSAAPLLENDFQRQFRANITPEDLIKIDSDFGLHPALKMLGSQFKTGQASLIHGVAGPYRERSHFLAQDLLESGTVTQLAQEGWLNRALQHAPTPLSVVSIGPSTPYIIKGPAPVQTWSPPLLPEADMATLERLSELYEDDLVLSRSLAEAIALDEKASDMMARGRRADYKSLTSAAGKLLSAADGPDMAVVSLNGWDSHAGQAGFLNRRLKQLDDSLSALKTALGSQWSSTVVTIVTEFGRTARQNGTKGTDHGTASAAFLMGGALSGKAVLGDFPGLSAPKLFESRDLYPANDLRSLFMGVLSHQFGFSHKALAMQVFPDAAGVKILDI